MAALVAAALVGEEAASIAELGDFLEMAPEYVHATLKAQVSGGGGEEGKALFWVFCGGKKGLFRGLFLLVCVG